jgi:serine/threonine protein kinase
MTFPILTSEDVIAERWQVLRRINSGGAAAVYAVKELGERVLALKVVHRRDRGNARRLKAEFDTLSCLDHPNLVRVHEWGEEREMSYYTMALVPGVPLREFIQAGMLTLVESLELYRQVLDAVAYLHKNEVIHRDLKPGNILVDKDRHVTLIDLGACRSPLRDEITVETDCSGTPGYMSPEQAAICVGIKEPAVRKLAESRQADIYALGLLLYHLLSGQWPHGKPGKSPAELAMFYRRRATEKPAMAEFPDEVLGRLAMAMLLPAYEGRPSELSGVITTFEAAFAAMREDSQQLSPLCAEEVERLAKEARQEEHVPEQGEDWEDEGNGKGDPSETYTPGERVRLKLKGLGFLSASGAVGGLVVALLLLPVFFLLGRDLLARALAAPPAGQLVLVVTNPVPGGSPAWFEPESRLAMGEKVPKRRYDQPVPTFTLPGQKVEPCDTGLGEVAIHGNCWAEMGAVKPPCGRIFRHEDKCYRPIAADPQKPVQIVP